MILHSLSLEEALDRLTSPAWPEHCLVYVSYCFNTMSRRAELETFDTRAALRGKMEYWRDLKRQCNIQGELYTAEQFLNANL